MFLATSEIAVAMATTSAMRNPRSVASRRPPTRAETTPASPRTSMTVLAGVTIRVPERLQGAVHVPRRRDAGEVQPELDHGVGDLGRDARHDAVDTAEPHRLRDRLEHPARERVEDVEAAHVDDDAPRPELANL